MEEQLPDDMKDFIDRRSEQVQAETPTDVLREIRNLLASLPDEIKKALQD